MLARMEAPGSFTKWCLMNLAEEKEHVVASLEVTKEGKIFCAFAGFKNIYTFNVTRDTALSTAPEIKLPTKLFQMSSDCRSDPTTIYVTLHDRTLRVYTVGSDQKAEQKISMSFKGDPFKVLTLKSFDILLGSQFDRWSQEDEFSTFKITGSGKSAQVVRSDVECNTVIVLWSWLQTGPNSLAIFDGKQHELVEFEIRKI